MIVDYLWFTYYGEFAIISLILISIFSVFTLYYYFIRWNEDLMPRLINGSGRLLDTFHFLFMCIIIVSLIIGWIDAGQQGRYKLLTGTMKYSTLHWVYDEKYEIQIKMQTDKSVVIELNTAQFYLKNTPLTFKEFKIIVDFFNKNRENLKNRLEEKTAILEIKEGVLLGLNNSFSLLSKFRIDRRGIVNKSEFYVYNNEGENPPGYIHRNISYQNGYYVIENKNGRINFSRYDLRIEMDGRTSIVKVKLPKSDKLIDCYLAINSPNYVVERYSIENNKCITKKTKYVYNKKSRGIEKRANLNIDESMEKISMNVKRKDIKKVKEYIKSLYGGEDD